MIAHRIIIIAKAKEFPTLVGKLRPQQQACGVPTRSDAGRGDQASAGSEVRG